MTTTNAAERERLIDLSVEMIVGSPLRHVARAAHARFIDQLLVVIRSEIIPRASATVAANHSCRRCDKLQDENEKLRRKNADLHNILATRDRDIERFKYELARLTKTTPSTASAFTELDHDD